MRAGVAVPGPGEVRSSRPALTSRYRRTLAGGLAFCMLAALPVVIGDGAAPRALDLADGTAWLLSEVDGRLVRVNGATGKVDAEVNVGAGVGAAVAQDDNTVLVAADGTVRSLDVAKLDWGGSAEGSGQVVVGDGVAYVVAPEGEVREVDPATLGTRHTTVLDGQPGRGVVVDGRLALPLDDGTVRIVDGGDEPRTMEVGTSGDAVHVVRVGRRLVALNASQGTMHEIDGRRARFRSELDVALPDGDLIVPSELPAGPLWLVAVDAGELLRVDLSDGAVAQSRVVAPRTDVAGPTASDGRVYVVDRDQREIVEVDGSTLEVTQRTALAVDDASRVEVLSKSGYIFVNDLAGSKAVVIDDGTYRTVDKESTEHAAGSYRDGPDAPEDDMTDRSHPDRESADGGVPDQRPPGGNPTTESPADGTAPDPGPAPGPSPGPATDPPAAPPATVTPQDPPTDLTGLTHNDGAGGTLDLSWNASTSSEAPVTYVITLTPAVGGESEWSTTALSWSRSGLAVGTAYTVTVTPTNDRGAGGQQSARITPGRGATVDTPTVSRTADRTFSVQFTYDDGGRPLSACTVTRSGGSAVDASCSGGTGSASVTVPSYHTSYTFTATVQNDLGSDAATSAGATSAAKPFTIRSDASAFDGTCTWNPDWGGRPDTRPYFPNPRHACPEGTPVEDRPIGYLALGTTVRGECHIQGGSVTDDNLVATTTWIRVSGRGYMPTIYVTTFQSNPTADLPAC